jgi:hypothetical protein
MAIIQTGGGTSGTLTIDSNNAAKVALQTDILSGFASVTTESDDGTVLGTRSVINPEASQDFRLRTGIDQILFNLAFEGTNIARDRIQQNDTTATAAQTNGVLTINSGSSVTTGQGCNVRTYRTFSLFGAYPTYVDMWIKEGSPLATFSISEWGLGYCSGVTAQLTDGVFFRRLPGGQLRAVMCFNSVDVATTDITETNIPSRDGVGVYDATETNHYFIEWHNNKMKYWINDTLVAVQNCVSPQGSPTSSMNQPFFARVYISGGTASAARSIGLNFLGVTQGDMGVTSPLSLCGMGNGAYQIQPGTTSGPTVTRGAGTLGWPTSATARAAGTWTATTAPALNSLGGLWTSPAISTLTSDVDYPIFSYQNPAGTATLPGKNLYITGIRVGETCVSTVASTNAIILSYAAGIGSTSSATTATEGAVIVAARIVPLGQVSFLPTAAVGDMKSGFAVDFSNAPLVCYPGHFVQFIVRPFGTVTSNTLVVTGSVTFIGYHS